MLYIRYIFVILLTSIMVMSAHIYLVNATEPLISAYMSSIHIAKPPYNSFITTIAYITSVIPILGQVILYYFVAQNFSCNRFYKALIFAFISLLINGEFLRMPLMNYLVGNPLKVIILQDGQSILVTLLAGFLIAFTMPATKKRTLNENT